MQISTAFVNKKIGVYVIGYESKPEIARALDGWIGHIDTIIAGDGKFDYYDAPNDYSEDGWLDFAEKRYKDKVEFVGYQYAGDQFTKRQMALDIGGKLKLDYLIAVDTEEYVDPKHNNFDKFYRSLYLFSELTKDRVFYQYVWIPSAKLWPKQGNKFPSNRWLRSAKIHKNPGTMRFCLDSHFMWCSKKTTDEQLIQWQLKNREQQNPYQFAPVNVIDGVRIKMDRTLRTKEQIKKSTDWAFMNHHSEESKKYYKIAKAHGTPPPYNYKTWEEFEQAPHTFDSDGRRIELNEVKRDIK